MKTKSLLIKLGVMGTIIMWFWMSFTLAMQFNLNMKGIYSLWSQISKSIIPIHFVDNWNDFGWFIYFSNETRSTDIGSDDTEGDLEDSDFEWWDCESMPEILGEESGVFEVKIWETNTKECERYVRWLYYNAERGDRLRPLDDQTLLNVTNSGWLVLSWWIYTNCRPGWYKTALNECYKQYCSADGWEQTELWDEEWTLKSCVEDVDEKYALDDAYYGMITWKMPTKLWWETFVLLVWVKYNASGNGWVSVKLDWNNNPIFSPNFKRINRLVPLGFVYDYNWGIWFAGCEIKDEQASDKKATLINLLGKQGELETLFSYVLVDGEPKIQYEGDRNLDCENIWIAGDSLIKLIIEWLVWVNRESDLGVVWNQLDPKMQYFSSSDISSATLLNYAKQRTEILCRWKWKTTYSEGDRKKPNINIVCLSGVNVDAYQADVIKNEIKKPDGTLEKPRQTLVVKNGNVTVTPITVASDTGYYDIFINNGNLIINESESTSKFVFTRQWFITGQAITQFMANVNSALVDWKDYTWDSIAIGSAIRWNFIVDWSVKSANQNDPKLHNKYFIYGKFSTKDSFKYLEDVFVWRCSNGFVINDNWELLSPVEYCPPSVYENASLVVIDQNYQSPLYW